MKRVNKNTEPPSLQAYRQAQPQASWDELRNNARQAYDDIRSHAFEDQRGLCAYCEMDIRDNAPSNPALSISIQSQTTARPSTGRLRGTTCWQFAPVAPIGMAQPPTAWSRWMKT